MTWTRRGLLAAGLAGLAGGQRVAGRPRGECFDAGDADARIGLVGDVMVGRRVNDRWVGGDPAGVWGSTLDRLQGLDGLVVNLECCLSERGEPWPGKTYHFRADPSFVVPALSAADVSVAALANNHVLDFGEPALRDTLDHLSAADVAYAGAGLNRASALSPAIVDAGGLTVATISLTDRFGAFAATESGAGTAYTRFDRSVSSVRSRVRDAIHRAMAHDPDLVVASLHWGPNWETAPDAAQVAFARWLVDSGVDVVHGHSAHVLQGIEVYRGRPIIYDAGDFVDDYSPKDGFHNKRSALFELRVVEGRLETLRIVPIEIEGEAATLGQGEVAAWVRETMIERSALFGTTVEGAGADLSVSLGTC